MTEYPLNYAINFGTLSMLPSFHEWITISTCVLPMGRKCVGHYWIFIGREGVMKTGSMNLKYRNNGCFHFDIQLLL